MPRSRTLLKVAGGVVVTLVILLVVAFFAFVPFGKEPAYTFLKAWGEPGSGPGKFNAPGGVAVAENGDLFVPDFYNHRVQHLKADGAFFAQWGATGEPGRWAGKFIYPTDAAMGADGAAYVADGYGDRIQVFASGSGLLRKWGGPFAIDIFGPFNGWFAVATSI